MRPPRLELHIEELVVDGVAGGDPGLAAEALRDELARQLEGEIGDRSAAVGAEVARAVRERLGG
jgi:hypothetical protein